MKAALALLFVALALSGCKKLSTGAAEQFAKEYSCPAERMSVTPNSGINRADYFPNPWPEPMPPPEIKNDPGRLAVWSANLDSRRKMWEQDLDSYEIFEVKGCDEDAVLACRHVTYTRGSGVTTYYNRVTCKESAKTRANKDLELEKQAEQTQRNSMVAAIEASNAQAQASGGPLEKASPNGSWLLTMIFTEPPFTLTISGLTPGSQGASLTCHGGFAGISKIAGASFKAWRDDTRFDISLKQKAGQAVEVPIEFVYDGHSWHPDPSVASALTSLGYSCGT